MTMSLKAHAGKVVSGHVRMLNRNILCSLPEEVLYHIYCSLGPIDRVSALAPILQLETLFDTKEEGTETEEKLEEELATRRKIHMWQTLYQVFATRKHKPSPPSPVSTTSKGACIQWKRAFLEEMIRKTVFENHKMEDESELIVSAVAPFIRSLDVSRLALFTTRYLLTRFPNVQALNLERCNLGSHCDSGISAVANSGSDSIHLSSLGKEEQDGTEEEKEKQIAACNRDEPITLYFVANCISRSLFGKLVSINLAHNSLTAFHCRTLCDALYNGAINLERLDLRWNELGDDGMQVVAEWMERTLRGGNDDKGRRKLREVDLRWAAGRDGSMVGRDAVRSAVVRIRQATGGRKQKDSLVVHLV